MNAPTLDDIARALGGEVRGDVACFPTPGHSKKDRGSWASIKPGAPDGVLIHCSNGGDPIAVKDMLRDRGVLPPLRAKNDNIPWRPPERETTPARRHAIRLLAGQKIVETFEFFGPDGTLLYRKHRIEPGRDRAKEFAYDHPDGNVGWRSRRGGEPVPYRLPDLIMAPKDLPIFMAEGEAKADRLAEWGFLATSHKDWRSFEFSGYVHGRQVFILPDNDATGADLASKAFEAVERAGGKPFYLRLPTLPEGGDILDWDGSSEDLRRLADQASVPQAMPFPELDLVELSNSRAHPKAFIIDRLAPAAEVTLFTGAGSAGKSLLAQQFATAAAIGRCTLGFDIEPVSSIYVTCEDDEGQLHWRQEHISSELRVSMADLAGKLHLVSLRGEIGSELATFAKDGTLKPTEAFHRLAATINVAKAKLVFLDNVAHLFTGNENDRGDVTRFINLLNKLAGETGAAIVLIGHPNKSGDDYSGSTAWLNAVRSQFVVQHDQETDVRTLIIGKANYARKGDSVRFVFKDWAFVGEDDLPPDQAKELAQTIRASRENEIFLSCLDARMNTPGREVGPNLGPNYAPARFAEMTEAKGLPKAGLVRAMERLLHLGTIVTKEIPRKGSETKTIIARSD